MQEMDKRYTDFELPGYKYIPQKEPHPSQIKHVKHIPEIPDGSIDFSSENWQQSHRYLYAIDLFNLEYYWEVHEVLEKLWMELGKKSDEGIFIQGLIQLSVALLKNNQKNLVGFKRLYDKALPKLKKQQGIFLGIDVEAFLQLLQKFIEEEREQPRIKLVLNL
jgi:predicted metal-dependent hydrolase